MHENKFIKYAVWICLATSVTISLFLFFKARVVGDDATGVLRGKIVMDEPVMLAPTLPVPQLLPVGAIHTGDSTDAQIVFVPRVVDGDTIIVEPVDPATGAPGKADTVRYIGMDTPETVDPRKPVACYGHEAALRNKTFVLGKYVAIVRDASDRDRYGRLLRFVYLLDDTTTSVNAELVKEGYARVLTIPPDLGFNNEFKIAAASAKAAGLGFWGACAKYPFGG